MNVLIVSTFILDQPELKRLCTHCLVPARFDSVTFCLNVTL